MRTTPQPPNPGIILIDDNGNLVKNKKTEMEHLGEMMESMDTLLTDHTAGFMLGDHSWPLPMPCTQAELKGLEVDRHYSPWGKEVPFNYRKDYISRYGFSVVTKEELDMLVAFIDGRKVIDVGCGTAYLTRLFREAGVDIAGMDNTKAWQKGWERQIDDVIDGDFSTADLSEYDIILCSWPCYESDAAAQMLLNLDAGKTVLYLGENEGGCCADDGFFDLVDQCDELPITDELRKFHWQFSGIHDRWTVFTVPGVLLIEDRSEEEEE